MATLAGYFTRLLPIIEADLQTVLQARETWPPLFYHMLHYHMGWADDTGSPSHADRGKRIRPMLALLVSEAVCGDYQPARPAAAAVELIHNFSLLHDDIQDRSPTRRNRPTVWKLWGDRQAINAGDALFALAHLAVPRLADPATDQAILNRLLQIIDETSLELTRGQHLDMALEAQASATPSDYLDMIAGKTAALIASAAQMGAIAARADEDVQCKYHAFGMSLGFAFQVLDDVLDIWGDPISTGKEAARDIRERKKTLPILYGLSHSVELQLLYANEQPLDQARVEQAVALLNNVGAREYAEELARAYSEETIAHLEAAHPQGVAGQALFELVDMLLHRQR